MRTIVVNQGALGDLLVSIPALRLMRKHRGDFTLAGEPERCLFLKASGEVSSVFPTNSAAFAQLYSGSIPPHLDYFNDIWWFTRRRGLVPTILMMPDAEKQATVVFTVDESPDQTNCSVFQFNQVKSLLGVEDEDINDYLQPFVYAKPLEERRLFDLAVHPGSGSPKKNIDLEIFFRVTTKVLEGHPQMTCCYILGPAEGEIAPRVEEFALKWEGRVKIANCFDLKSLSELLGSTRVFWGNDSGVTHLAAWCGTRTLVNFGPTNPRLWRPICGNVSVLQSHVACSPCGEMYNRCEELACLKNIDESAAFSQLQKWLEQSK